MPKFSANLGFLWHDRPLLDRVQAAADAGFRAIELHWPFDTPATELRAACQGLDLELLGINTPPGDTATGEFGLAALPGREAAFADAFRMTAAYARAAGAGYVHIMVGNSERRDASHRTLLANLDFACSHAPDLTLLLEAINVHDAPGYFYSRQQEVQAIVAAHAALNLRMMFDCYHVGRMGENVVETLENCLPLVGHVQIASVPDRSEPDHGSVDYREVFAALDRLGYRGWVGCEYRPSGDTGAGLRWMEKLGLSAGGNLKTTS